MLSKLKGFDRRIVDCEHNVAYVGARTKFNRTHYKKNLIAASKAISEIRFRLDDLETKLEDLSDD